MLIDSLGGGGTERVCVRLANEFIRQGYSVNIFIYREAKHSYIPYLHREVNIVCLNISSLKKDFFKLFEIKGFIGNGSLLIFNPQAAIIIECFRIFFLWKAKTLLRINNTLSVASKTKGRFHRCVVDPIMKVLLRRIPNIICQSSGMYSDIVDNYYVPMSKLHLIGNPIDTSVLPTEKPKSIGEDIKYILYVGRLKPQKSLDFALRAFYLVQKDMPSLHFYIIGSGESAKELSSLAIELGIKDKVIFLGLKDNVRDFYKNAELTVLSSLYEGFPNVLLESIALGTPVVSFDSPSGPKDIVVNGVNGYLCKYMDENDMAEKIKKSLSKTWDKNSIVKTINKYSVDNIARKYVNAYFSD